MSDIIINDKRETTAAGDHALDLNGGRVIVGADATISASGAGANGIHSTAKQTLSVYGSVSASGYGIAGSGTGSNIVIGSSGTVHGNEGGIFLSGHGPHFVVNNGTVTSVLPAGPGPFGFGIRVLGFDNHVTNGGIVSAHHGIIAGDSATGLQSVVNTGSIFATGTGIQLSGADNSTIVNTGLIKSDNFGVLLISDLASRDTRISLTNSGTIIGPRAIAGSDGSDLITNDGWITGAVSLWDGNDVYDGRDGTLHGLLSLGEGADTAYGGKGVDQIDGGAGNDIVNGGAGIDTAVFTGQGDARVDLRSAGPQDTGYGQDWLIDIENITSGDGRDRLTGNAGANALSSGKGDDYLEGGLGNDILNGGEGTDTAVFSGSIAATVNLSRTTGQNTGHGFDTLIGIENLKGGSGHDRFNGNDGANRLTGGLGNDRLDGGAGIDTAAFEGRVGATVNLATTRGQRTGHGTDTFINIENLSGTTGADTFTGNSGSNRLDGHAGNDVLRGAKGDDVLSGGAGNDVLDGGAGSDTADYSHLAVAVRVGLGSANAQVTGEGRDTLIGIENVRGGSNSDTLIGNAGDNRLEGGAGDDLLIGGLGRNDLIGGAGIDTVGYGIATTNLTVNLALGQATGLGTDILQGIENVIGGKGGDAITGNSEANLLDGGAGNDVIVAGAGADILIGGLGKDDLTGGAGQDVFRFGTLSESGFGAAFRDAILDFEVGQDKIDLSALDADTRAPGNQAFVNLMIGALNNAPPPFIAGTAAQLYYDTRGQVLYGETTGDGIADFELRLEFNGRSLDFSLADFIV